MKMGSRKTTGFVCPLNRASMRHAMDDPEPCASRQAGVAGQHAKSRPKTCGRATRIAASCMTCISTPPGVFPDRRGSRPTTVPPLFEFKDGLSTKPVDGDLTQPTLPERAQTRSRYRRSCRRVEPALIK